MIAELASNDWLKQTGRLKSVNGRISATIDAALGELRRACLSNDAKAARQALLDWASAHWPKQPPRSLEALERQLPLSASRVLRDLDRQLYAAGESDWCGSDAWPLLQAALGDNAQGPDDRHRDTALPPLYPEQSENPGLHGIPTARTGQH